MPAPNPPLQYSENAKGPFPLLNAPTILTGPAQNSTIQATKQNEAILREETIPDENNSFRATRRRLAQSPDYPFPILYEEKLVEDPVSDASFVESIRSYVANELVLSSRTPIEMSRLVTLLATTEWRIKSVAANQLALSLVCDQLELDTVADGLATMHSLIEASAEIIIEPNRLFHLTPTVPNDPILNLDLLWGLDNEEDKDIDGPEGWDIATNAENIVVAIMDSGIRHDHEDLTDNMWRNPGEIPDNGIDDDENGYIDDIHGANLIDPSKTWEDDNGHGTHVAGIVGASGNNDIGITGVAWNVQLMAVKAANASGGLTLIDSIEAIDYAIDNGAHIINASWGGPGESPSIELAIERALDKGIFFVTSAGNDAINIDHEPIHPADSAHPNVITVASFNELGHLSSFSNYGIGKVEVAAPGSNIISTWHASTDSYALLSGTSMAAPHISGMLALNLSLRPDDDMKTHIDRLIFSSKPSVFLNETVRSQGMASLAISLAMDEVLYPPIIESHSLLDIYKQAGKNATLNVVVSSESDVTFEWLFQDSPIPGETETNLILGNLSEADEGEYTFVARNEDGEASITFQVTVLTPDPSMAAALDIDPGGIVFTRFEDHWRASEDPKSRGGSHVEGDLPPIYQETTLESIVSGPGELRFLWKLDGVTQRPNFPTFHAAGAIDTLTAQIGEWQLGSVLLREARNYELKWILRGQGKGGQQAGKLIIDYLKIFPIGAVPPIIYFQPIAATAKPFDSIGFSIGASGTGLSYDWYRDDELLDDDDRWRYSIRSATTDDEGDYHVVVSNDFGSDISHKARLEIDESQTPAFFIERDNDFTGVVGSDFEITLEHGGSPTIDYRWSKDGVELPGEVGPVLRFSPLRKEHGGRYTMEIENAHGPRQYSNSIWLQTTDRNLSPDAVLGERDLFTQRRREGDSFEFDYFIETAFQPAEFQWYHNGIPIAGQTNRTLILNNLMLENSGDYFIEIRNDQGSYRTGNIDLVVDLGIPEALDDLEENWNISPKEDLSWIVGQNEVSFDGEDALEFSRRYPFDESNRDQNDDGSFSGFITKYITGPTNVSVWWKRTSENAWFEAYIGLLRLSRSNWRPKYPNARFSEAGSPGEWQESIIHVPEGVQTVNWIFVGTNPDEVGWLDQFTTTQKPAFVQRLPNNIVVGSTEASLAIEAWGEGDLAYQWTKNGLEIANANSSTLKIPTISLQPDDQIRLNVTSEFGTATTPPILLLPIAGQFDERATHFTLGGDRHWESESRFGIESLVTSLEPGESSWIEFEVTGPALLMMTPTGIETAINSEIASPQAYEGPDSRSEYFYIDSSTNLIRLTASIDLNGNSVGTFPLTEPRIVDPIYFVKEDPAKFRENSLFYKRTLAVYFAAMGPVEIRWYKNDILQREILSSSAKYSRFFDDDDAPNEANDAGVYYCEITDVHGNIARSEDFHIRDVDTRSFGENIGDPFFTLCDTFYPFTYDTEIVLEGDASAKVIIPAEFESTQFQICIPHNAKGLYPLRKLSVRLSGTDDETEISLNDGEYSSVILENSEEWQSFSLNGNSSFLSFNIRKPKSTEVTLWIDGASTDYGLRFLEQPMHFATYLNGTATFSATAFSDSEISYQWRKEGEDIPGANEPTYTIENISLEDLGGYDVVVSSNGTQLTSESVSLSLTEDLASAIEMPGLLISTWGNELWSIDNSVSIDGTRSIRSGEVKPGKSSVVRLEHPSPGMSSVYFNVEYTDGIKRPWENRSEISSYGNFAQTYGYSTEGNISSQQEEAKFYRLDRFSFSPLASISYNEWIDRSATLSSATSNSSNVLSDQLEDSDDDGIPNLLEYLFDLDPFNKSKLPAIEFKTIDNQLIANLDYRFAATGAYTVSIELSEDLLNWYPISTGKEQILDANSKYFQVNSSLEWPTNPPKLRFLRLRTIESGSFESPIRTNATNESP